ncbi:MAG: sigma-70 family RNA polymerase sigma factor [Candidatus Solibacter usitatus]|nr:sigma-70 family RNA polymerase sigma factor [Candidatus Solibacter usitatus]
MQLFSSGSARQDAEDPAPDARPDDKSANTDSGRPEQASELAAERWIALVDRIRDHNEEAMEELYRVFSRGIRYYLCRHLGPQELEDKVHDTFLIVVQAIRGGGLREPEKLMGFVRTVVRRQVAAFIDTAVQSRRDFTDLEVGGRVPDIRQNPEERVLEGERSDIMAKVMRGISRRDREILTRFYLFEQTQEQICEEMNLTETQFRLLKSRAKARFGELGRRKLARIKVRELMLRKATGSGH